MPGYSSVVPLSTSPFAIFFYSFFFGFDEWEKQTKQNLLLTLFFPPEASEQRCYNGHVAFIRIYRDLINKRSNRRFY